MNKLLMKKTFDEKTFDEQTFDEKNFWWRDAFDDETFFDGETRLIERNSTSLADFLQEVLN